MTDTQGFDLSKVSAIADHTASRNIFRLLPAPRPKWFYVGNIGPMQFVVSVSADDQLEVSLGTTLGTLPSDEQIAQFWGILGTTPFNPKPRRINNGNVLFWVVQKGPTP